ncbi:MAG TPA: DMT family transporter [Gemmatimonadaceae bacterium]|nr:DMT family transporter [Gemmatimonadaceae bacterium]
MAEPIGHPIAVSESSSHPGFGMTDLLLFLMATIWGSNFVVVKYATSIFTPLAFTGLRVGSVAIFMILFAMLRRAGRGEGATSRRAQGQALSRHVIARLLLLGVLGNGLYQLFFVLGVARTRAGNAALIVGAAPAFIALAASAKGLERIQRMTMLGIALSIVGVGLVMLGSANSGAVQTTFLGAVLVFLGVVCWTFYTVWLQPYTKRVDVITLSALTLCGGAVPLWIVSGAAIVATDWSRIGVGGWLALLYSSIVSMGIAYLFYYRGLRVLGPTRTAVYSNLQPIIALLVAWPLLGENPTAFQVVGAITIVAGVFMTRA